MKIKKKKIKILNRNLEATFFSNMMEYFLGWIGNKKAKLCTYSLHL